MLVRGRTVVLFVVIAMAASSMFTFVMKDTLDKPSWASQKQPLQEASSKEDEQQGLSNAELNKLNTTYQIIQQRFYDKYDRTDVIDGAINGMLEALKDPYSVYMDQEESEQFTDSIESSFSGIGAEVSLNEGKITVVAPIKGSPAEKAGVQPQDVILSVNGESLNGLSLQEAVKRIRGTKGTQAKLQIIRSGTQKPIELIVVRDEIELETVFSEMLDGKIGKIEIRQFSVNTGDHFIEQLKQLEEQGMKGLIIDVRNNPGGVLGVVTQIGHELIPNGKGIVNTEGKNGKVEKYLSKGGKGKNYPITVLMNSGSASASEILAGALRDSLGSKLIGEKTFGKGTVQTTFVEELGDGSSVKMTIAKWLTPKGTFIHGKGIKPDVEVSQPDYYRAAPLPKEKDKPLKYDMVSEDIKNLQVILSGLQLDPGRKDGYFSKETESAVMKFEQQNGLKADGIVDPSTAETLEQKLIERINDTKHDLQLKEAVNYLKSVQ